MTSPKIAFVSSSDHKYYPMLLEWVHSIRRFPESAGMDICIFDAGMTAEQGAHIQALNCTLVKPEWPCELPASKIKNKEFLKSCVCRPFIPYYFPGYDTYVWMDADTWVQKWAAVEMFIAAAQKNKLAVAPQTDRAYEKQVRIQWLGPFALKVKGFYLGNAKKAFGWKTAKALYSHNVLQAGVFALSGTAPHWKGWQNLLLKALKKGPIFTAEQMTMGVLIHLEKYEVEILPAYMHWLCNSKPLFDKTSGNFVEKYMPHETLGILHLSGFDEMRVNRKIEEDIETLCGETMKISYRYPYFNGETNQ